MRPALTYSLRNNESTKSDHASIANDLRFFFCGGGGGGRGGEGDWGMGGSRTTIYPTILCLAADVRCA